MKNSIYKNGPRKYVAALLMLLLLSICTRALHAEIGAFWPPISRYDRMRCSELSVELAYIRKDLIALQQPGQLNNPKWYEANKRFTLLKALYGGKCRRLSPEEAAVPKPPATQLPSEAELQAQAKQAIRGGRLAEAKRLLTAGANAGYASAQYDFGMLLIVIGEKDRGMYWLQRASQQGHSDAIRALQSLQNSR